MKISIRNLSSQALPISYGAAKKLIRKILPCLGKSKQPEEWLLGIVFLNDTRIKLLNQKYLKANRPTDVLVFNYGQNTADLAISLESAKRNAKFYKASLKKELVRYIIHGLLHLYGYDDRSPKDKKIMFKHQEQILNQIIHVNSR
ncbi:MAG: rRNA maturation RNase YbeY [Omnitrophica WOR_2 bacterium RIFCSPHIGHO2_02_FULL_45_21]|nr:MAG: rRNA maturation RNase YbeY [Omnitrophica WOR_2 bacterium RIFCSPHIGHO2_02_FULL_45_21]